MSLQIWKVNGNENAIPVITMMASRSNVMWTLSARPLLMQLTFSKAFLHAAVESLDCNH